MEPEPEAGDDDGVRGFDGIHARPPVHRTAHLPGPYLSRPAIPARRGHHSEYRVAYDGQRLFTLG